MIKSSPLILGTFIAGIGAVFAAQNVTLFAPDGTSFFTATDELCLPAGWQDILGFFAGNYVAHAATVRVPAGSTTLTRVTLMLTALFFPGMGMITAVSGICGCSAFAPTPIETACRAGALVMVVRNYDWRPADGDTVENAVLCDPRASRDHSLEYGNATSPETPSNTSKAALVVFRMPQTEFSCQPLRAPVPRSC